MDAKEKSGILVLFYDAGLKQLLEKIRPILFIEIDEEEAREKAKQEKCPSDPNFDTLVRRKLRELEEEAKKKAKQEIKCNLVKSVPELRFGEWMGNTLMDLAKRFGLEHNLRILTALDLVDVFSEMSEVQDLRDFFLGEQGNIGYDSPKIVEAIVRLRLLGSGIPVFRLDQDVLFPSEDKADAYNYLREAVAQQLREFDEQNVQTTVYSTILSTRYEKPEEAIDRWKELEKLKTYSWKEKLKAYFRKEKLKAYSRKEKLKAYSRGYATRVQPVLRVNLCTLPKPEDENPNWEKYASDNFNDSVAKKFFDNANLIKWGASTTAVISGALLYMSDGVVLNVPPFSNFSLNVVWIDDHLRYALHRELGDFSRTTIERKTRKGDSDLNIQGNEPVSSDLNVQGDKPVIKCRIGFNNLPSYTLCTYLPSLLWGSVVDAWICEEPIIKLRKTDVTDETKWHNKKDEDSRGILRGILAERIKQAQAGRVIKDEAKLREDLRKVALTRIYEVRTIWSDLCTKEHETFASCWAKGDVHEKLKNRIEAEIRNQGMKGNEKEIAKEIARGIPDNIIVGSALGNQLERLITDAVNYLRWVQKWPQVVQVVRSIRRETLPSDLPY